MVRGHGQHATSKSVANIHFDHRRMEGEQLKSKCLVKKARQLQVATSSCAIFAYLVELGQDRYINNSFANGNGGAVWHHLHDLQLVELRVPLVSLTVQSDSLLELLIPVDLIGRFTGASECLIGCTPVSGSTLDFAPQIRACPQLGQVPRLQQRKIIRSDHYIFSRRSNLGPTPKA
eukprot:6242114-Pyramimonas_sp.AAC.1